MTDTPTKLSMIPTQPQASNRSPKKNRPKVAVDTDSLPGYWPGMSPLISYVGTSRVPEVTMSNEAKITMVRRFALVVWWFGTIDWVLTAFGCKLAHPISVAADIYDQSTLLTSLAPM